MINDTSTETTLFEDDLLKIVGKPNWCFVFDKNRGEVVGNLPGGATAEQVKFARRFFDMGYSLGCDSGREMIQSELRELLGICDGSEEGSGH